MGACAIAAGPQSAPKIEIAISPSGHFISYRGRPILLLGDSGTHCGLQNLNFNYRNWLDACASRGLRAVHIWSFVAARQKQDGSVTEPRWGYLYPDASPWRRMTYGPSAYDQKPRWNLQQFDDGADGDLRHYWPRLRDLCSYAKRNDIVVGITVFFGWPKHNDASQPDWSYHPLNEINGGFLSETNRLVTGPQTIQSPGREILNEPWSDRWPPAKKTQWVWERFANELITQTLPMGNVFYVFMDEHSYSEGNCGDHFCEFFRRRGAFWVDWGERRDTVDAVYDQGILTPGDDRRLKSQFAAIPHRPFLGLEEGGESRFNYTSDLIPAMWRYAAAGGNYFHHDDEKQESKTTGVMVFDPNVRGGKKQSVLERLSWIGHASRLFNETVKDLDKMAPHDELLGSAKGVYCLANPGHEYVVYAKARSQSEFALELGSSSHPFRCRFYNPMTGEFGPQFNSNAATTVLFTKPDSDHWVLYVSE
jgi:hypothetical protein